MGYKFFLYKHQDKGNKFREVLLSGGWEEVTSSYRANLVFADLEGWGREKFLNDVFVRRGVSTVLYPHGPVASCSWNFPGCKSFPFVAGVLLPASGHIDIMKAYGAAYLDKVVLTGWPYSPVREFARTSGRSIVFAPIHPNANGFLSEVDKELNRRTLLKLIELKRKGVHEITVRYIGELPQNGLWVDSSIKYVAGEKSIDDSLKFMSDFDLIVGHHTFAFLAIAIGKPTLMFGEFVAPKLGGSEKAMVHAINWRDYRHIMMFPLDILVEDDVHFLVERATYSDYEISDWKAKMIGGQFNSELFLNRLELLVNGTQEKSTGRNSTYVSRALGRATTD